jgi:hypothetical protein
MPFALFENEDEVWDRTNAERSKVQLNEARDSLIFHPSYHGVQLNENS